MTAAPQPYPQQHAYQPYQQYRPAPPTNTMAILALVMAFVFPPLGFAFGLVGRKQIRATGESGDGLALAGAIVGGSITALFVLYVLAHIVFFLIYATLIGVSA